MSTIPPAGEPLPPAGTRPPSGYERYRGYYNRPYPGCGCLITLLILLMLWWLVSLLYPPVRIWQRPLVPPVPPSRPAATPTTMDTTPVWQYDPRARVLTFITT